VKNTFFSGNPEQFKTALGNLLEQLHIDATSIKDLSIAALMAKLISDDTSGSSLGIVSQLLSTANQLQLGGVKVQDVLK
jgi:hypothetical protein